MIKIVSPLGTSLVVQWLKRLAPNAEGPGLIPGWGTRSRIPRIPSAATNTWHSQINKYFLKKIVSPVKTSYVQNIASEI